MIKKAKQLPDTPVVALFLNVWQNANDATSHSWERLNHSMRKALELAIGSGMKFVVDDFKALSRFNPGHWMSDNWDWVYSMAIAERNYSAATAWEEYKGREPLIADGVSPHCSYGGGFSHGEPGTRQTERLHIGASFLWKGEKVKVTSFNGTGGVTACSYQKYMDGDWEREKLKKRYTITRELIIEDRAERKEREQVFKQLSELCNQGKAKHADVLSELEVSTRQEYDALPMKKIHAVAVKYGVMAEVKGKPKLPKPEKPTVADFIKAFPVVLRCAEDRQFVRESGTVERAWNECGSARLMGEFLEDINYPHRHFYLGERTVDDIRKRVGDFKINLLPLILAEMEKRKLAVATKKKVTA